MQTGSYPSKREIFLYLPLLFLFSSWKLIYFRRNSLLKRNTMMLTKKLIFLWETKIEQFPFLVPTQKWKQRQSDIRNILTRFITTPSFINSPFDCILSLDYGNPITTYVNTTICWYKSQIIGSLFYEITSFEKQ